MTIQGDQEFFQALPKAELHAHLSGSISPQTLHDLWTRKQRKNESLHLPNPLTEIQSGSDGFVDVHTFFPLFDKYIYLLCNDIESVQYATRQVLEDFERDGVRYLELRTTPRESAATGMSKAGYVESIGLVLAEWNASKDRRMEVYLILSVDRKMTVEQASEVVDIAVQHQLRTGNRDGFVVGVDLCGNPLKGDVSAFTPAFSKARTYGLAITVHFAEVPQSSTDRELETLLSWNPDRLGHCVHIPSRLIEIINDRKIGVEICLSCNILAGLTTGGYNKHHLREWLRRDCPIALSTDDVGIFASPLSQEYMIAAQTFLDTKSDVVRLARSAVATAFAGGERMMGLLDAFENSGK